MKALTSFLGSARRRRAPALDTTAASHEPLDKSPASSPTDSSILYAFPAPPCNDLPFNVAASSFAYRTQYSPPDERNPVLANGGPTPNTILHSSQWGGIVPPQSASASSFIVKRRATPRGENVRQGHQLEREPFECPRSAPTPPVSTATSPTPHDDHQSSSFDSLSQTRPPLSSSNEGIPAPHQAGDPDPIPNSMGDPPQLISKVHDTSAIIPEPSTPRKSRARRTFGAILSTSANSLLGPPAQPPPDPKLGEAAVSPPSPPSATSSYISAVTPTPLSTPPRSASTLTSTPDNKSKKRASNRFRSTSNATPVDTHNIPPTPAIAPSTSLHEHQQGAEPISGTSSRVASPGITSPAANPRLAEGALRSEEAWDFGSPGPDPFRANSPVTPAGFASLRSASQVSTPGPSVTDALATPTTPTSANSQQSQQPHSPSSRLGAKIHQLLHSRSSRNLKESAHNHPAPTPRTVSEQQLAGDTAASSGNPGRRPYAKSIGSQRTALPSSGSSPVGVPLQGPFPLTPTPTRSHFTEIGSNASVSPQEQEHGQPDSKGLIVEEAANAASLDELVIGIRSRGDNKSRAPSVISSLSNTTVAGAGSTRSFSGAEPPTPTSISSRTFALGQPHASTLQFRSRSRASSSGSAGRESRSVRSPTAAFANSLSASVGPRSSSSTAMSSAPIRAMRTKRSMPELDGVWKGFLEEIEEDATVLLPSVNGTTSSADRNRSAAIGTKSETLNRRPRRATTSGTTASILSSSPLPPTPDLPPLLLPPSSSVGSRRPHVPPRLSLSSSALSSKAQNTPPTSATKSPAPSATSSVFQQNLPSVAYTQSHLLSPVTPPFTPASDDTDFPQSVRHNRPISTATASSTFTIKAKEPPVPSSMARLIHGGSALVSPAASMMSQGGAICDGTPLTAVPPIIRQESASSRHFVMDNDQGDLQSDGSTTCLDNGSSISLSESLSSTKGASYLDPRMRSMSPPGSGSASTRSAHSRATSSLSLASSVNSATHLNPSPVPTHFLENGSQTCIGGAQQLPPIQERDMRVYSRSPSHKLTTSTDSSIYTSNESGSLLSWRSDPEEMGDDFGDRQITVASSVRSRASSRAASLLGNEMGSTMTAAKGHTLYHLPSRSVASVTVSPPASPTKATMMPNGTLKSSPHGRYRPLRHTPQSSVSSISSISSSLVGTSANLTRSRALPPISTRVGGASPPATPPKTAAPSPTDDDQLTPSFRMGKPHSASMPPSLVTTLHTTSSRQHDADLVRAVRALEAEAQVTVLAAAGGGMKHRSLAPAAAKSLAPTIPTGERAASGRPEMHARSRSHDPPAPTTIAESRPSRDRSASHPPIADEVGYAV